MDPYTSASVQGSPHRDPLAGQSGIGRAIPEEGARLDQNLADLAKMVERLSERLESALRPATPTMPANGLGPGDKNHLPGSPLMQSLGKSADLAAVIAQRLGYLIERIDL